MPPLDNELKAMGLIAVEHSKLGIGEVESNLVPLHLDTLLWQNHPNQSSESACCHRKLEILWFVRHRTFSLQASLDLHPLRGFKNFDRWTIQRITFHTPSETQPQHWRLGPWLQDHWVIQMGGFLQSRRIEKETLSSFDRLQSRTHFHGTDQNDPWNWNTKA